MCNRHRVSFVTAVASMQPGLTVLGVFSRDDHDTDRPATQSSQELLLASMMTSADLWQAHTMLRMLRQSTTSVLYRDPPRTAIVFCNCFNSSS